MVEFGEKLKRAREEKGMTQQTLSDALYVTRQAVSRWECGVSHFETALLVTPSFSANCTCVIPCCFLQAAINEPIFFCSIAYPPYGEIVTLLRVD